MDPIHDELQRVCNGEGDGWSVAHYVVTVGLERFSDGEMEVGTFIHVPPSQPDYISSGLLLEGAKRLVRNDVDTGDR